MEDAIFKDYANGGRHLFQSWWIGVVLAAKDRALVDDSTIINCCTCRIRWSIYFVAAEDKKSKYCRSIRFWCTTAMIHNNQPPSYSSAIICNNIHYISSYATIYITYPVKYRHLTSMVRDMPKGDGLSPLRSNTPRHDITNEESHSMHFINTWYQCK